LGAVREKLRELGARLEAPLHFESNDLYDDTEGRLAAAGRALRPRRTDASAVLTHKGPARLPRGGKSPAGRGAQISDPEQVEAILAGLGLERRFRYQKKREEWAFFECAVALDETPIGTFVEIEGSPPAIRRAVGALEMDFSQAIPYTYARLYQER